MFGVVDFAAPNLGALFARRAWTFGGSACIGPAPQSRAPRRRVIARPRLYRVQSSA